MVITTRQCRFGVLLLAAAWIGGRAAAEDRTILFRSGAEACYQIPAAARSGSGTLIAAAEQRFGYNASKARRFAAGQLVQPSTGEIKGCGDSGYINIVARRSTDGGASWSPARVVVDSGQFLAGGYSVAAAENPTLLADGDTVALIFTVARSRGLRNEPDCLHPKPQSAARCGAVAAEYGMWQVVSRDAGAHWSAPAPIALPLDPHRIDRPGPGHGIVLRNGRWVVPTYHGLILSDDRGRSWRAGAAARDADLNGGESSVAELPDGSLWSSARPSSRSYRAHPGSPPFRITGFSRDGGVSYANVTADARLPMPPVSAGLLSWQGHLLVSYPSSSRPTDGRVDMAERHRLTIAISRNGGRNWQTCLVDPGTAAYSDLLPIDVGSVGVVYEGGVGPGEQADRGFQEAIVFRPLPLRRLDSCGR